MALTIAPRLRYTGAPRALARRGRHVGARLMIRRWWLCALVAVWLVVGTLAIAQDGPGKIKGRVVREGDGVSAAVALIHS